MCIKVCWYVLISDARIKYLVAAVFVVCILGWFFGLELGSVATAS